MNSGQSPSWDIQRNLKHPNLIIIPYIPGILCFLLCILVIIPSSGTHRTFVFCTRTGEGKKNNTHTHKTKKLHHTHTKPPPFTYSALCAGSRSHPAHQCFSLSPTCQPHRLLWSQPRLLLSLPDALDRHVLHIPLPGNNTAVLFAEDTGDWQPIVRIALWMGWSGYIKWLTAWSKCHFGETWSP